MLYLKNRINAKPLTAVWRNGGCRASYDSFVVGSIAVLRLNFCGKNPPLWGGTRVQGSALGLIPICFIKLWKFKIQNLLKSGIIAGLIASAINVILYIISKTSGIVSDEILLPNGVPLSLLPVVISSLLPGIVAALVLWGISKISKIRLNFSHLVELHFY